MKDQPHDINESIMIAGQALQELLISIRGQRHLLEVSDRVLRRLEFMFPDNSAVQQAALYWMAEQGDEDDAALLSLIPKESIISPYSTYAWTVKRLTERLGAIKPTMKEATLTEYLFKVASEILPDIKDSLRSMIETSEIETNQTLNENTRPLVELQQEAEVASRRLQYLFPASVQDYEANLRWFREAGWLKELVLLFAVPPPSDSSNEIRWLHQSAQDQILERLIHDTSENGKSVFHDLDIMGKALRPVLGPRGSVVDVAERRISSRSAFHLTEAMKLPHIDRNNLATVLGEWGGLEEAEALVEWLKAELAGSNNDEKYQICLISGLSNLGGTKSVEALLEACENGIERIRLASLSSLEFLATAGPIALTERSEPLIIDNIEKRDAYVALTEQLHLIASSNTTPSYVQYKANELLDTLYTSLEH